MDIRQSVLGEILKRSRNQVTGTDIGALVRRLLLFDVVVVKSARLREVPSLVKAFGTRGLTELINTGILKLVCEWTTVITDVATNGVRALPRCHFSFGIADIALRETVLREELRPLQGVSGLKNAERAAIEELVLTKLTRPDKEYGSRLQAQVESDLRTAAPAFKAAIEEQVRARAHGANQPFSIRVEETQSRVFHVLTDIGSALGFPEEEEHSVLQSSVAAVANLDHRIADMEAYSAITGFAESEAPLLFRKLAGVISPQNPAPVEHQFARVIAIAGLPEFEIGKRVDVDKLLKARESSECREFRVWLAGLTQATDQQIADMVEGFRSKVAFALQTRVGKTLRFAVTTALGLIPGYGAVTGPATGALDTFLLQKAFPASGVFAFLTDTYPSLFVSP